MSDDIRREDVIRVLDDVLEKRRMINAKELRKEVNRVLKEASRDLKSWPQWLKNSDLFLKNPKKRPGIKDE